MIVVHHLDNSRSHRVLWLLEELGEPYEIRHYQRDPLTKRAPAGLRAVHPLGKAPVIADGERVVAESGAIVEYLLNRHPGTPLRPLAGTEESLRFTYWLHYAEGSLMPLLQRAIVEKAQKSLIAPEMALHLDFLESELEYNNWFAGDEFSAADIQMSFAVELAATCTPLGTHYPNLAAFLRRIRARPAYARARAFKRGGPLSLSFCSPPPRTIAMNHRSHLRIARHVLLGLVMILAFALLFGWVVMQAWNAALPALLNLPAITFWQAVAVLVLARILTGRFTHGHTGRGRFHRTAANDSAALYAAWWDEEGEAAFQAYAARQLDEAGRD